MQTLAKPKKRAKSILVHTCCYSLLFAQTVPFAYAAPTGAEVTGGTGTISQSGNATTINQNSQNMSINWQSYNVGVDERVQYVQPNASSVSLNRILSNNGSTIAGRIDANGRVILVNPNGLFFTPTAVLNVGSLIASGLDINSADFMNGNGQYIFNGVEGTSGTVTNSGMINASVGGNVALIGKQVKNDGVIVANLGTVSLAAGKETILTFDDNGLLGVRVSQEILQSELGVDPAIINNGAIQAQGGKVLLTASQSQDIFSRAVNTNGIEQATSAVVNDDGSFTLGGGADVVNSGAIDTSTTDTNQDAGRVVIIGENVTNSGAIKANAQDGNGGDIELHARDTTLLTQDSVTSARSETNGKGGVVKVLADKVGVLDQSTIDVSGANGGGQALIGGDFQGKNSLIRNANRTFVSSGSNLYADALAGDGGTIINWGNEYTWFYGNAFARGGLATGNGGLVEISGKGLSFDGKVDVSAANGSMGTLLFDPRNIVIQSGGPSSNDGALAVVPNPNPDLPGLAQLTANSGALTDSFFISEDHLESLSGNANITLQATNNVTMNDLSSQNDDGLNLRTNKGLTFYILADSDGDGAGAFTMLNTGNTIYTRGGEVSIQAATISMGAVNTSGRQGSAGGNITLAATSGNLSATALTSYGGDPNGGQSGRAAGNIQVSATGSASLTGVVSADGNNSDNASTGGNAGTISITGTGGITLGNTLSAVGGQGIDSRGNPNGQFGNGGDITLTGPVTLNDTTAPLQIAMEAYGATRGNITFTSTLNSQSSTRQALRLAGQDVTFSGAVGNTSPLGALEINATGAVNAGTNAVTATSLSSANSRAIGGSASFTAGTINTFNTADGQSGGLVDVRATEITLNGDIDTRGGVGGTSGAVTLTLTAPGSLTLNYLNNFTSPISVTGSSGLDVLNAANRVNNWLITGNGVGSLNTVTGSVPGITFSGVESLAGGTLDDTFTVNPNGIVSGSITTGSGTNIVTIENTGTVGSILGNAGNGANTINVNAGGAVSGAITLGSGIDIFNITGTVGGLMDGGGGNADVLNVLTAGRTVKLGTPVVSAGYLNVDHVETINATGTGNTLLGHNNTTVETTWNIDNPNHGVVTYTSTGTTSTTFNAFNNLSGGIGEDRFILGASGEMSIISGGTGAGTNTLVARQGVSNTWNFASATSGSLTQAGQVSPYVNTFSNIQTFTGGGSDWANVGALGSVNAGSYINFVGLIGGAGSTLNGSAGADVFSLQAVVDAAGALTDGTDDGTVTVGTNTLRFIDFATVNGGAGDDRFIMDPSGSSTRLLGGGDNDTLIGRNTSSTWTLANLDTGSVAEQRGIGDALYVTSFEQIENLTGGGANDTFMVNASGNLSGLMRGGGGIDTVNLTPARTVNVLASAPTGSISNGLGVLSVFEMRNINSAGGGGTLIGPATGAAWTINTANSGWVNVGQPQDINFSGFVTLRGGDGDDSFRILTPSVLAMSIDGGGETTRDFVDYSATPGAVNVIFGIGAFAGIADIEAVRGNGINSTLHGPAATADWTVTGVNSGTVSSGGFDMGFDGFNYLNGGGGDDTFVVSTGSLRNIQTGVPGLIQGGAGTNRLYVDLTGTGVSSGQINYIGSANDTIAVRDTSTNRYGASYTPVVNVTDAINPTNTGNYEQLSYRYFNAAASTNSALDINYRTVDSVGSQLRVDTFTVNGTAGETTVLGNGNFAVGGRGQVAYSNINNLSATGGDAVDVRNTNLVGGVLTLADTATATVNGLTAASLVLSNVGQAGTAATPLNTSVGSLSVLNSGPVFLRQASNLNLGPVNTASTLDINVTGNLTSTGPLLSNAAWTLNASGDITLANATLSGSLRLTGNAVQVTNAGLTDLGGVTANNLTVNASGGIAQSGALNIAGTTALNTPGATIVLNDQNNRFNILNVTAASAVSIHTQARINSGTMQADNISLFTNGIGNLTTQTARLAVVNAAGAVNITNTGATTVSITNMGDINLTNTGNVVVERVYANGGDYTGPTPYRGDVVLTVNGAVSAYTGPGSHSAVAAPDIIAENLTVNTRGDFGTPGRSMSIRVNDTFAFFGARGYVYYFGGRPASIIGADDLVVFSGLAGISNQQLIEIESLEDIDPAIFTAVRNYYHEDVAIMMPDDQRFDTPDESEDEKKKDESQKDEKQ